MLNIQQIVKELKKSLLAFDLTKAIENSDNEAKTRMYLVEPFFEILRFYRGFENGNLIPEYDADFANLKGKKVDYAILFKGKPEILVEVKKASMKLHTKNTAQLNEYFNNTTESKIGILTNGLIYEFYCRNAASGPNLHPTPFYTFNWENVEGSQLEKLAEFYAMSINLKDIIDKAQDSFFLESFEEALYKEISKPSKEFIKAIFAHMNGNKLTENIEKQIRQLINSVSIKAAFDRLVEEESATLNSGIITTEDEIRIFNIIKTILAHNKQIDTNSIGYKDFKGKFSIIMQDSVKKKICDLYISKNSHVLEIDGERIDIPDIDSIVKLKKRLTDKAIQLI